MPRAAAIGIDVDSLRFYRAIHGLPPGELEDDPIYRVAMPRFFELLDEARVPATLFLIGEDAARRPEAFAGAAATGCEVASHSFAHDYRLTQRSPEAIAADLRQAHAALLPLAPNGRLEGFRAPGYNVTGALLREVAALGYRYDSSLLPAPAYYLARAGAIAAYGLLGRPSASLRGRFAHWIGPLAPYRVRPEAPERPDPEGELLELPMACEPLTRAPLIGTSWVLLPPVLRLRLLRSALDRLPFFNFELHAIDLLEASDPGVPRELAAAQRDLRIPFREKRTALGGLFSTLREAREVVTLAGYCRRGDLGGAEGLASGALPG